MTYENSSDLENQMDEVLSSNNSLIGESKKIKSYHNYNANTNNPLNRSFDTYNDIPCSHIATYTTDGNEDYILLGKQKFKKEELMQAFAGTLIPGISRPSAHKFANPAPLGLSAFALTTFVLSMVNAQAMGVTNNNIVIGLAIFYGGFIQLLAGMWEMAIENTFGALALSSYGGFWMSFAAISIPWFGIADSYTDPVELNNAVGFYLLGWSIFTFMLCLVTMKSTVPFFSLFLFLAITFLLLAIGKFTGSTNCDRAAGVIGILVSFIAFYNAYSGLATPQNSYIVIKPWNLPRGKRD